MSARPPAEQQAHDEGYWEAMAAVVMLSGITAEALRKLADALDRIRTEGLAS